MAGKYRVRFVNFGYYAQDEFDLLNDAIEYVNSKGFEASVEKDGVTVASKTTFSGWAGQTESLVPRSFAEVAAGDVILLDGNFHTVKEATYRKDPKRMVAVLGSGRVVELDGLVYTKG